jgi:hypothetical protein
MVVDVQRHHTRDDRDMDHVADVFFELLPNMRAFDIHLWIAASASQVC